MLEQSTFAFHRSFDLTAPPGNYNLTSSKLFGNMIRKKFIQQDGTGILLFCPQNRKPSATKPEGTMAQLLPPHCIKNGWTFCCTKQLDILIGFLAELMSLGNAPQPTPSHSNKTRQQLVRYFWMAPSCLHNLMHHISSKLCLVLASHYMLDRTFSVQ